MLALIPLIASLAPELVRWLAGDKAGDVAGQVANVVRAVTGSDDPAAVQAAIADPAKAAELRLRLAEIAAQAEAAQRQADLDELKAALADTANARQQTVALAQAGSPIAYGAVVVSALVLAAFGATAWLVLTRALPEGSQEVAIYTVGSLQTMAAAVVAYWVGSSAGSHRKDVALRGGPSGPLAR